MHLILKYAAQSGGGDESGDARIQRTWPASQTNPGTGTRPFNALFIAYNLYKPKH